MYPIFRYTAVNSRQQRQQGTLQAESEQAAIRTLAARGFTVLELHNAHRSATSGNHAPKRGMRWRNTISATDQVVLLTEISTLLKAGVSLAELAPSLANAYRDHPLGPVLDRVRQQLHGGSNVGQAFRHAQLGLPEYIHVLIESGEAAGKLADAIGDATLQLEYERSLAEDFRSAMVYPSVLVGAGSLAVVLILMVVVPRFSALLKGGRADIPLVSRWVIESGLYLRHNWLTVALVVLACVAVLVALWRRPAVKAGTLSVVSHLPVSGPWIMETEIGRWATLLGTLLGNRVGLLEALVLSRGVLRLPALQHHVQQAESEVRQGRHLSDVLLEQSWIPETRLNLVRVGERAGQMPHMFAELGRLYTSSARQRMRRLLALVEPVAILLIGGAIGFIMVAVMLAITSLNTATL